MRGFPASSFPTVSGRVCVAGSDKLGSFGHGWTYSAHPLCAAAGVANLELLDSLSLIDNARDVGAYFRSQLSDVLADHKNVGDIRGEGLLAAVEFVADKDDASFSIQETRLDQG